MMDNNERQQRPRYLLWVTAATLLALAALPFTGWIVRQQAMAIAGAPAALAGSAPGARQQAAGRRADDFPVQLAHAIRGAGTHAERATRLRALTDRFGDRPPLYAAILRFASDEIDVSRDTDHLLQGRPAPIKRPGKSAAPDEPVRNRPEHLAAFDGAAAAGERLDPDNAFFPLMRATGLFAARRDDEALAAIARASEKPGWEEYLSDEISGQWRLSEAIYGEPGALSRTAVAAATLFPHYAALRACARVATYKAVEAEQAGDIKEGFRIRQTLARCGGRMRAQSPTVISSLVGVAITQITVARPGGAPALPRTASAQEAAQRRLLAYTAYVEQIGQPEEARWVRKELATKKQISAIWDAAEGKHPFATQTHARLLGFWGASLYTLVSALWLLVFGTAAALLYRLSPGLRKGQPLTRCAPVGMVAALCLLGGLALWQMRLAHAVVQIATSTAGIRQADRGELILGGNAAQAVLAAGLLLAVPLLLTAALALSSRIVRVPVTVGVVRGLRGLAMPIGCGLLLLYGVLVLGTARQEARVSDALRRMVRHEGRYLAEITGRPWPGETR